MFAESSLNTGHDAITLVLYKTMILELEIKETLKKKQKKSVNDSFKRDSLSVIF